MGVACAIAASLADFACAAGLLAQLANTAAANTAASPMTNFPVFIFFLLQFCFSHRIRGKLTCSTSFFAHIYIDNCQRGLFTKSLNIVFFHAMVSL
jgi:ABC-type siderophore export system fused ATPase/permease subunit